MSGRERDDGLSEVIGFILIIGLLVIIASLYMTYMVPAQGREAEIQQMDYIKQQFLDYKINTDALWINNAVGTAITQSMRLGTEQQETSGSFAGFGIMQPVGSGGLMEVNSPDRPERISILAAGVLQESKDYLAYDVNPVPKIQYINPASGTEDDPGTTITIVGSGFASSMKGYWDDKEVVFTSSTSDSRTISVGADNFTSPGYHTLYVENLPVGGGKSNQVTFTVLRKGDNQIPVITGISGSPSFTVTGYESGDVVFVNGKSVGSSGTITSSNIPDGMAIVTLYRPPPGGGTSNGWIIQNNDEGNPKPIITSISPNPYPDTGGEDITIRGDGFDDKCKIQINDVVYPSDPTATRTQVTIKESDIDASIFHQGMNTVSVINGTMRSNQNVVFEGDIITGGSPPSSTTLPLINETPNQFILNFTSKEVSTNGIERDKSPYEINNTLDPYGISFHEKTNNLSISLVAVPRIISKTFRAITSSSGSVLTTNWDDEFSPTATYNYAYQTDLVLNINKSNTLIIDNYTLASNIKPGTLYNVDLSQFNIFSGLQSPLNFENDHINSWGKDFDIGATITQGISSRSQTYGMTLSSTSGSTKEGIYSNTHSMGALEYKSMNHYYQVQENFTYQMGGVSVNQPFGGTSSMVMPSISISKDPTDNRYLDVKVADIQVQGPANGYGGSSPIQIATTAESISSPDIVPEGMNARTVAILVDPMDSKNWPYWVNVFKGIKESARSGGIPDSWITVNENTNEPPSLIIEGASADSTITTQDIHLEVVNVGLEVNLQPVGKAISIS